MDPRANSTEKLRAPAPLPHISRRALKRVKHPEPMPSCCRYCSGTVKLVDNSEIYGRSYGEWPYMIWCETCDAYVGLHPHTDIPLGTLADKPLREARKTNKALFLRLQREQGWSRTEAYSWLADEMKIPAMDCHWGLFEEAQCEKAGRICERQLR